MANDDDLDDPPPWKDREERDIDAALEQMAATVGKACDDTVARLANSYAGLLTAALASVNQVVSIQSDSIERLRLLVCRLLDRVEHLEGRRTPP